MNERASKKTFVDSDGWPGVHTGDNKFYVDAGGNFFSLYRYHSPLASTHE